VVELVPLVKPEKYAWAMAQKKKFPCTSVNGSVTVTPLHEPVSDRILPDRDDRVAINTINTSTRCYV